MLSSEGRLPVTVYTYVEQRGRASAGARPTAGVRDMILRFNGFLITTAAIVILIPRQLHHNSE